MIVRRIFRLLWVALAFFVAVGVAAALLLVLGGSWVGEELRAVVPEDPLIGQAAPVFGVVLFAWTVAHALTALPALIAVVVGEALKLRTWIYYVLAGGAASAAIPLLATPDGEVPVQPAGHFMTIFAAAGFAGGFAYWLLAGRNA
jgi:hypothetical protein